jgi:hypothetical protein
MPFTLHNANDYNDDAVDPYGVIAAFSVFPESVFFPETF